MRISDAIEEAQKGYLIALPNFEGYFEWNTLNLIFKNKGFQCNITDLDVIDRTDFYKII